MGVVPSPGDWQNLATCHPKHFMSRIRIGPWHSFVQFSAAPRHTIDDTVDDVGGYVSESTEI